jgi:hypothetical protein
MRLMVMTLVVAFLVIVDFAKYHGRHTGDATDLVWRYAARVTH